MASSKLKLLKILHLLQDSNEQSPINAAQIVAALKREGIPAERKAIYRDINLLRDEGNYSIATCPDKCKGFYLEEHLFEDWELKILLDTVDSLQFLTHKHAQLLCQKLLSLASKSSRGMLSASLGGPTVSRRDQSLVRIYIDHILRAIKADKQLSFQYTYTSPTKERCLKREGKTYRVNPYSLVLQNGFYYLVCNYDKYANLSFYRLDKMIELNILGENRKPLESILGQNADIRLREYIDLTIYRYTGKKTWLTLEFHGYLMDSLIDRFGPDLQCACCGEDRYRTTVPALVSDGLYFWLLQFGNHIQIIAPQEIRLEYIKRVQKILEQYQGRK